MDWYNQKFVYSTHMIFEAYKILLIVSPECFFWEVVLSVSWSESSIAESTFLTSWKLKVMVALLNLEHLFDLTKNNRICWDNIDVSYCCWYLYPNLKTLPVCLLSHYRICTVIKFVRALEIRRLILFETWLMRSIWPFSFLIVDKRRYNCNIMKMNHKL